MTGTATFMRSVADHHAALVGELRQWCAALAAADFETSSPHPEQPLPRPVLPARNWLSAPLDPRRLLEAFPPVLFKATDPAVVQSVQQKAGELIGDLVAANDEVLRLLGELAVEAANHRTLLTAADAFDVAAVSVLAATSLANLFRAVQHVEQHATQAIDASLSDPIELPLAAALAKKDAMRPGDLWLLDLAARSVRVAAAAAAAEARVSACVTPAAVLETFLPRFHAMSLLHKLLEADQVPRSVAEKSQYQSWPGLELLLSDPGAEGLRWLVVGELARRLLADSSGHTHAAFYRFLEALLALQSPSAALQARLLIAGIFWEILDQDEQGFRRLLERPRLAPMLLAAIRALKSGAEAPGPTELARDRRRLAETCACLNSYSQYRAVADLPTVGGIVR